MKKFIGSVVGLLPAAWNQICSGPGYKMAVAVILPFFHVFSHFEFSMYRNDPYSLIRIISPAESEIILQVQGKFKQGSLFTHFVVYDFIVGLFAYRAIHHIIDRPDWHPGGVSSDGMAVLVFLFWPVALFAVVAAAVFAWCVDNSFGVHLLGAWLRESVKR